jgi:hypothetical protein
MVVRYELVGHDLAGIRFAISPLNEMVLSLHAWRDPGRYPLQLPWIREMRQLRPRLDAEMLLALVNEALWTPDFLNPSPRSPLTRLDDEFATVAATPAAATCACCTATARCHDRCGAPACSTASSRPWPATGSCASPRTGHACGRCWRAT